MDPTIEACLRSWPYEPWLCVGLALTAVVYLRGVQKLNRRAPQWHSLQQSMAFLAGLAAIFVALASPLDTFAGLLLSVHMVQHLLLMFVAPVLLCWCRPARPLELGFPRAALESVVIPIRTSGIFRVLASAVDRPLVAGLLFVGVTWIWHLPAAYELALSSQNWHRAEHASFLIAGLVFWRPVVLYLTTGQSRAGARGVGHEHSYWLLPYLFLTDLAGTALSAVMAFSGRVLYPHYSQLSSLSGVTPLDDQALAGGLMWVLGSIALLVPAAWVGYRLLADEPVLIGPSSAPAFVAAQGTVTLSTVTLPTVTPSNVALSTLVSPSSVIPRRTTGSRSSQDYVVQRTHALRPSTLDLLQMPLLGALFRRRETRLAVRCGLLLLAAVIVIDGLTGPPVAAMNMAGVLPWIHWRGLAVLSLLLLGNLVCYGCPLTLSRSFTRSWYQPRWRWPRMLRNKWLAAALLALFLLVYEAFDLWASPWWTAWIVVGYFIAAALVDALFEGATFCKYVCPIGQFQFVQSLMTPWEIRSLDEATCTSCRTHDCLHGNDRSRGCELELFVPHKSSNLDCTLCLACVDACPSNNVGLMASSPLAILSRNEIRSGVRRISARPDLAALVVVFVFGAFANAAGMVAPVVKHLNAIARTTDWPIVGVEGLAFLLAAIALPTALTVGAAALDRWCSRSGESIASVIARATPALVPIGAGMWLAHYGFHLFAGMWAFLPAGQRFMNAWGWRDFGAPDWSFNCCAPVADGILKFELLALDFGLLASLYVGYRIASRHRSAQTGAGVLASFLPWACLIVLLFAVGVWIVFQPMEMRGMLSAKGNA